MKNIIFILSLIFLFACQKDSATAPQSKQEKENPQQPIPTNQPKPLPEEIKTVSENTQNKYTWLKNYNIDDAIINRIPLPEGYKRIQVEKGSFADWLRHLPLKEKGSPVLYYNGQKKYKDVHYAVVDIDRGKEDLQQCADAVMRLKSEYHYSLNEFGKIHFNYTSGDKVAFDDWRKGKRPIVKGNKVTFSSPSGEMDNSYRNFKKYLKQIFTYAGTASLSREMKKIDMDNIHPGNVFIIGGHPGHAVIVMDVAKNSEGRTIFMLAQSYMPAQDIHILQNFNEKGISPWYTTDFENELLTPEWTFERADLKRFM